MGATLPAHPERSTSAPSGARRARARAKSKEAGYALILAAVAILFLAVVSSVILHAAAGSATSATFEVHMGSARTIAAAGVEWAIATDLAAGPSAMRSFGGGSFVATRSGRTVQATGTYGLSTRAVTAERTIVYVPDSRFSDDDSLVEVEIYNLTGADVGLTGLSLEYPAAAFYEKVELSVFADTASGALPVDYGTIWTGRAGSGEQITFAERVLGAGRQALLRISDFKSSAGSAFDMDPFELRLTCFDAAGPLPGTPIPRATQ